MEKISNGKIILQKRLKRSQMEEFFANLPPTLIGIFNNHAGG